MKFQFIRDHREDFPVRLMCGVLEVSPSGFYDWLRRPESPRAAEDRALVAKIQAVHGDSRRTYGSPRVHASLKAEGYRIGRKRVARLMRENDIRARTRRKFRVTTDRPTGWTGNSRSRHRTRSGWPISATSRLGRAGCTWPSCSTSTRARWSAGRWTRRCPRS
jgi:transposase InsO family protein